MKPPNTARRVVTALSLRGVRRGALVVGFLSAGMCALVASQHAGLVSGAGDVASLEALAGNVAVRTLFGPPRALDDAGGFTVWRTGTVIAVLVAAWTLLTATRITRGEEEAGRWVLLLSGTVTLRQVVLRHLAVLVAADVLVGLLVALALVASGTAATGAALHGAGVTLVGAVFAALGVLAAQVLPDRRSASGAAAGLLLLGLLLRMVADGVGTLAWMRWATPFGLLAETRPYAGDRLAPLPVIALAAVAAAGAALTVADRRDLGDGLLRPRDGRAPRTALLGSVPAFLLRRTLRPWSAWAVAVGAYFLLIGLLATSLTQFLQDNPRFAELAAEAGFSGLGTVEGYVASLFGLLAVPVGLFAAGRLAADVNDEDAGRLTGVLARPVTRVQWLAAHAALLLVASLTLCLVAGVATWVGATWVGSPLGLSDALAGASNPLPVAALALGAAAFALGWAPRAVLAAGAVPVVGGFLWLSLGEALSWPSAVRVLSPFAHLPPVPSQGPDLLASAVMLALATGLTVAGAAGFTRRDLRR